jgi:arsenate reductase-like glutaredoxin family protein
LDKQVLIHSVDTSFFYDDKELKIHNKLKKPFILKSLIKKRIHKAKNDEEKLKLQRHYTYFNKRIKKLKELLKYQLTLHKGIRTLNDTLLSKKTYISVFDSVLTRTLGLTPDKLTEDIMVVQTYYFKVLEDIILNGYMYKNEKYVCFTASAGQIRTKKTVFIKEAVFKRHLNSLTCGLSIDHINEQGGVNINKYLAYLALCNSATDEWKDFDISKTIVVDDMETTVRSVVDYIDDSTYEITRKEMDILISHTDGCGMILPRKNKRSMMVRLPWIKGLLVPFPFDKFVREVNHKGDGKKYGVVTDIYGKQHDLIKDGIEVIFTKSQFKMYKYYRDWQSYKDNFVKYNCQAGKCNEEESLLTNAKINYQMLQTLTDMTNDEIETLSKKTKESIINIGRDKETMLKVLGVVKANMNKNYLQQALEIYPELLSDTYSKEILKNVKRSMVKDARAAKIDIEGKYTFICPDLYAYCQWLILGEKQPSGLLQNGQVSCRLYKEAPKLDCLRSPHLYLEHAVRNNIITKEMTRWFVTDGVYTSIHDPISKILMFDVDGDKGLVCADPLLIEIAERNMQDIVPLYYDMKVAGKSTITNRDIYNGLKAAYTGGNIGVISNNITKIWNSDDLNLDVIKWLCMENNFTIDYAKTLYKLKRPKDIGKQITQYTKKKVPHFFMYAKDKQSNEVEKTNNSVVNRLSKIIPNTRINFEAANIGKFSYKMLMSCNDITIDNNIIALYTELDLNKHFIEIEANDRDFTGDNQFVYRDIRNQILELNNDVHYVVNVLVKYLYENKKSNHKTTLWSSFGDIIVSNLRKNIEERYGENNTQCDSCFKRIEVKGKNHKMCNECWKQHRREYQRLLMQERRKSKIC